MAVLVWSPLFAFIPKLKQYLSAFTVRYNEILVLSWNIAPDVVLPLNEPGFREFKFRDSDEQNSPKLQTHLFTSSFRYYSGTWNDDREMLRYDNGPEFSPSQYPLGVLRGAVKKSNNFIPNLAGHDAWARGRFNGVHIHTESEIRYYETTPTLTQRTDRWNEFLSQCRSCHCKCV